MAFACFSVKFNCCAIREDSFDRNRIPSVTPLVRQFLTIVLSLEPRRISMIRSMILHARIRPSWISLFSSSLFRSVVYFRVAISYWKATFCAMMLFSPSVSGLPPAIAIMLTPKVSSRRVFLYNRFLKFSTSVSFFSSMTMRIPSLEDWLEMSSISGAFFCSYSAATSCRNFPMFAPIIV